jgi:hypothetical protein
MTLPFTQNLYFYKLFIFKAEKLGPPYRQNAYLITLCKVSACNIFKIICACLKKFKFYESLILTSNKHLFKKKTFLNVWIDGRMTLQM